MKRSALLMITFVFSVSLFGQQLKLASIEKQLMMEICTEILIELYGRLDMDISVTPMSAVRAEAEVSSGNMDGEVARIELYGNSHPELIRIPSSIYTNQTMVWVRSDSPIAEVTAEQLPSYRVARIRGILNTDKLTENVEYAEDFDNIESMMEFVRIGRADLALTSRIGGQHALKRSGIEEVKSLEKPIVVKEMFHFLNRRYESIAARLDALIRQLKESGEMDLIIEEIERDLLEK